MKFKDFVLKTNPIPHRRVLKKEFVEGTRFIAVKGFKQNLNKIYTVKKTIIWHNPCPYDETNSIVIQATDGQLFWKSSCEVVQ